MLMKLGLGLIEKNNLFVIQIEKTSMHSLYSWDLLSLILFSFFILLYHEDTQKQCRLSLIVNNLLWKEMTVKD